MTVGSEAPRGDIHFNGSRPCFHEPVSPSELLDEVEEDPLDPSGGALVLQACQVLAELPGGQAVSLVLSPQTLVLVVAETALMHPG